MSKIYLGIILGAIVGLLSSNAFAEDWSRVKVYGPEEYQALADAPELMVSMGIVSDVGGPFSKQEGLIHRVQRKAAKQGADGILIGLGQERRVSSLFSSGTVKRTELTAEAFNLVEPSVTNIKAAIHNPNNQSEVAIKSAINHAIKGGYVELADDIFDEILTGRREHRAIVSINVLLDGYVALKGDKAIDGLRQIASANLDKGVLVHAGELMAKGNDIDGLYSQIVSANDMGASKLITSYTNAATAKDISKLRKLFKLHGSEIVRTEAGKALVRLHDDAYIEQTLQAERSAEVAKAVKKEMLLQ